MEKLLIETAPGETTQVWFVRQGEKLTVWHHGTPAPAPLSPWMLEVFAAHGYSVLCPVRRGYMGSTAAGPAPMADDARINDALVRHLGFDSFVSMGLSGGGPRALADAALNPLASSAVVFAGLGPIDQGLDYFAGMGEEDIQGTKRLQSEGMAMLPLFEKWADGMAANPANQMPENADPITREWYNSPDAQFRLSQPVNQPFETGASGWLFDEISFVSPWGFLVADIIKPVQIFHCEDDPNVPIAHSEWIHSQLPNSTLRRLPGMGHSASFNLETVAEALAKLV